MKTHYDDDEAVIFRRREKSCRIRISKQPHARPRAPRL